MVTVGGQNRAIGDNFSAVHMVFIASSVNMVAGIVQHGRSGPMSKRTPEHEVVRKTLLSLSRAVWFWKHSQKAREMYANREHIILAYTNAIKTLARNWRNREKTNAPKETAD